MSNPAVVKMSRDFVCARLATFESPSEADFIYGLYPTRSGAQVNTVFTILAPDGKTTLLSPGRSPSHTLRSDDPETLATEMRKIAARYKAKRAGNTPGLPYGIDLRRALNIASCDLQPLIVVVAASASKRKAIERVLTPLAWSDEFIGAYAYATAKPDELAALADAKEAEGVLVVYADPYGLSGKVVASAAGTNGASLTTTLRAGLAKFRPKARDSIRHIREARRRGIEWEVEVKDRPARGGRNR